LTSLLHSIITRRMIRRDIRFVSKKAPVLGLADRCVR
jgi:hypothetical protein